jgi:hypothetical protein
MNVKDEFRARRSATSVRARRDTIGVVALILLWSLAALAQNRREQRPDYGSGNGTSAGGKWTEYRAEDPMTAAKRVRFEIAADSATDHDEQGAVILYCTNGKLDLADFRPNVRIGRPDWAGWWGQPQMRVRVRADQAHSDHSWNWINGHFLAMDKGTARELIGAHLFRIEFRAPDGPRIAEFSPAGLDLNRVKDACGLTPKKH